MSRVINYQEAIELLQAQVEKKGAEYRYEKPVFKTRTGEDVEQCAYFDPETKAPSCIVGYAVADLGITLDRLVEISDPDTALNNEAGAVVLMDALENEGLIFTDEARELFAAVQEEQDTGVKWGVALQRGIQYHDDKPRSYYGYDDDEDYEEE